MTLKAGPQRSGLIMNEGGTMTAFNAVRFRVKAGQEQEFLDAHKMK